MAISTSGDISNRTSAYAYMEFLKHAAPVQVLSRFGQHKPIPRNKTQTGKFRRSNPYDALTAPLQEGVTPSVKGTTFEDVTVTLQQWGDVHGLTDVVADTNEDPVLNEMIKLTGEQAGATNEQVLYAVLKGGSNVFYANGANRAAVNTAVSIGKVRKVVRALRAAKAKPITTMLSPSPNYGTSAIEAAYICVAHTDLEADIRGLSGFVPVAKYGSMKPCCPEEVGSVENVRFILSPDLDPIINAGGAYGGTVLSTGSSAADVYPMLFFGEEAFASVALRNQTMDGQSNLAVTPIVINPKPSASDPLGQRGYVGWKAWFTAVRLNETWMARLEVAASAL
jgi:N4-gp56 family major capsid protein